MIIEINKDIDRYKESVALGLTAKQLIFSFLAVLGGGSIVLALYGYIGLSASVYVAIPVVAPIALQGFYSFHGMSFLEVMGKKLKMAFSNRPLIYISTECEETIKKYQVEEVTESKAKTKIGNKPTTIKRDPKARKSGTASGKPQKVR